MSARLHAFTPDAADMCAPGWGYSLAAPGRLERSAFTLDLHALKDDEIAVAAEYSAISPGSEVAAWRGDPPLRPTTTYPRLVGYCHVGKVIAAGRAVTTPKPGERVLTFTDHRSLAVLRASEVAAVIEDGLSGPRAAVTYLYHLGYAALLRAHVTAGHSVVVIGLGALGLATVAVAAISGARVIAASARKEGRALARRCGAWATINLEERDAAAQAGKLAGGAGADVIVTTSNRWDDWLLALAAARKGGTIAVLGFPGRGEPPPSFNPLDSQFFYDKQLSVLAAGQTPEVDVTPDVARFTLKRNMGWLLERIAAGALDADILAGTVMPADALEQAYRALDARQIAAPTVVLQWA